MCSIFVSSSRKLRVQSTCTIHTTSTNLLLKSTEAMVTVEQAEVLVAVYAIPVLVDQKGV